MYMKLQQSVLKHVYKMEEKYNIRYAKKDGRGFSYCRAFVFIFAIWASFFAFVLSMGFLIQRGALEQGTAMYGQYTKFIVSCFSVMGLLMLCSVFAGFKKAVFSADFATAAAVYGSAFFASIIDRSPNGFFGLPYKYYWAHLLPLVAVAVCAISMAVIAVREQIILRREYKKVSDRLYEEYSKMAEDLLEEQWEEFLTNYNPRKDKKQSKNKE